MLARRGLRAAGAQARRHFWSERGKGIRPDSILGPTKESLSNLFLLKNRVLKLYQPWGPRPARAAPLAATPAAASEAGGQPSAPELSSPGRAASSSVSSSPSPAAAALTRGSLGFGFSAGGLLFPYYVGVVDELHRLGIITEHTKIAGASAGSLIAATYHSGLGTERAAEACLVLADDCRRNGTRGRLKHVLQRFLDDLLPQDAHERCSERAYVQVTTVFPTPRGQLLSQYHSRADLIAALLTSCHIPWWFDNSLMTEFRGRMCYDGGLTDFIPLPPAEQGVRVCCFPSKQMSAVLNIHISPDTFEPWPYSLPQMLSWAFEPGDESLLRAFIDKGRADARCWAEATGALAAADTDVARLAAEGRLEATDYSRLKPAEQQEGGWVARTVESLGPLARDPRGAVRSVLGRLR